MKKEYQDHWANLEDMHLLSRLRIGQMITNFIQSNGYVRDKTYAGKDPFYMSDDEFVKKFRQYMNSSPCVSASEPETPVAEVIRKVAKKKS